MDEQINQTKPNDTYKAQPVNNKDHFRDLKEKKERKKKKLEYY
jgi:hypothetical protein